jgi:hypothetical protein
VTQFRRQRHAISRSPCETDDPHGHRSQASQTPARVALTHRDNASRVTDFTIIAADVGRALGVPDGYLVNLAMTQGPAHETPSLDEGKQKFTSGYFVLRGSRD